MPQEMIEVLALGEEFDIALGAAVAGLSGAEFLETLEPARLAGDLSVDGPLVRWTPGRWQRAYAEMGLRARAEAHAHAGDVLARLRPQDARGVADQRLGAVAVLGLDAVLDSVEWAVNKALLSFDWPAAAALLNRAAGVAEAYADRRALDLRLRQARALYRDGRHGEAMAVCREVGRACRSNGDVAHLAESALVVRGIDDRDACAEMLHVCREVLPRLGGDLSLLARVRAQTVMLEAMISRRNADAMLAEATLELADRSGDPRAVVEALHAVQMAHPAANEVDERLRLADRMESLALEAGLEEYLRWPLGWRVDAMWQLGLRPGLDDAIARLGEYGQVHNDGLAAWKALMAQASLAAAEGRFELGRRLADDALDMAERGGHHMARFIHKILVSYIGGLVGDAEGQDSRVDDFPQGLDAMTAFPAMEAATRGDLELAAVLFERAWPARSQVAGHDLEVQTYWAYATVVAALERRDRAAELRSLLAPFAEEMVAATSGQAGMPGTVSLWLGEMDALLGHWEAMEEDFARALRRSMEFGHRPGVAETRYGWARGLLRRGLTRDRERAKSLLETAARESDQLGMRPLAGRVCDLLQKLRTGPGHPLSARELEVAGLVAQGLSNKEVAARLGLSVRTAENHLLNIMNKLGLENRAQVAAWVARGDHRSG